MADDKEAAALIKNGRICFLPYEATSTIGEIRDLAYRSPSLEDFDTLKNRLDVYVPTDLMKQLKQGRLEHKRPVIVFVHGGGWQRGDRRTAIGLYQNVGRAFAAAGYVAVLPSYRLTVPNLAGIMRMSFTATVILGFAVCLALGLAGHLSKIGAASIGLSLLVLWLVMMALIIFRYRKDILSGVETGFPRHAHDVADALVWIQKNIDQFGGDSSQIFFSGHSAGGHLVSLLTMDQSYLNQRGFDFNSLKGLLLISGVYSSKLFSSNPMTRNAYMYRVFGSDKMKWDSFFPSTHVHASAPPTLLLNASLDFGLVEHSKELEKKLKAVNVPVERYVFSSTHHGTIVSRIGGHGMMQQFFGERIEYILEQLVLTYSRISGSSFQSTHQLDKGHEMRIVRVVVRLDSISRTCVEFLEKTLAKKND